MSNETVWNNIEELCCYNTVEIKKLLKYLQNKLNEKKNEEKMKRLSKSEIRNLEAISSIIEDNGVETNTGITVGNTIYTYGMFIEETVDVDGDYIEAYLLYVNQDDGVYKVIEEDVEEFEKYFVSIIYYNNKDKKYRLEEAIILCKNKGMAIEQLKNYYNDLSEYDKQRVIGRATYGTYDNHDPFLELKQ